MGIDLSSMADIWLLDDFFSVFSPRVMFLSKFRVTSVHGIIFMDDTKPYCISRFSG